MRWKCVCAYEGTNFCGWQSQPNGNGVQDHIEARLAAVFKRFVRIHGSSRTDAGVHARGQVFHFDADWLHGSEALKRSINSQLDLWTEAICIRTDGRRITLCKGYCFRSVFIIKCKCYFVVVKINCVDKIINQSLFIFFVFYIELSKTLYPKADLFLR